MSFVRKSFCQTVANAVFAISILCLATACDQRSNAGGPAASEKNIITLTKDNFQAEVLSSSQPVLVDFWAVWCGPCKMIAPTVAELAVEFEGKAKVGKVDVDAETSLAKEYNISAIPALVIFKDGKPVDQIIGVRSKSDIKAMLNRYVDTGAPQSAPPRP